jgi:hypothetical protein
LLKQGKLTQGKRTDLLSTIEKKLPEPLPKEKQALLNHSTTLETKSPKNSAGQPAK